jgi:phytoene/squalene synthetase
MRDLEEDLNAGLINIPQELLVPATHVDKPSFRILRDHAQIRSWMRSERERALDLLDAVDRHLERLADSRGTKLLQRFSRSIRDYAIRRFPRQYPGVVAISDTPSTYIANE